MDRIIRRLDRRGHGAHSSPQTNRPRIGRIFLVLLLLTLSPTAANAANAPQGRIIGGTAATPVDVSPAGRWSAVVAIFATDAAGTRLCTGTLIAPNWVATAAHCVADERNALVPLRPTDVLVAAGVTSTQTSGDNLVPAVSVRIHPGFSWTNAAWDAALIELESTIAATPFALPDVSRMDTYFTGSADNVAGFGRSISGSSASSGTLRTGRIEQVNPVACATYNPGSGDYADCYLPGPARQATCFGDSGGPLVRFDAARGGTPVLWGITSTGPDPCDAATGGQFAPSFETRVTAIVDWIAAMMAGTSYVPKPPSTNRNAGTAPAPTTPRAPSGPGGELARAPAGGTGIGVFTTRLTARPSLRRTTSVRLTSSFVGATGTGKIELQRCLRGRCKTTGRATIQYAAAGTAVTTRVKVPRCQKRAVITLRLKVYDQTGALKDAASQRLARC